MIHHERPARRRTAAPAARVAAMHGPDGLAEAMLLLALAVAGVAFGLLGLA